MKNVGTLLLLVVMSVSLGGCFVGKGKGKAPVAPPPRS